MPGKQPVCLVVGGGPGIGYSVARKWAANGYQVIITRRGALAEDVLARDCGPGVVALQADVTDQERMAAVVKEVETPGRSLQLRHAQIFVSLEDPRACVVDQSLDPPKPSL